jgi:vacuolar-type H+-ATPase subunit H
MENTGTLDYLLKIETEAAVLVKDAQAEADRRIHENEEKNRNAFDERFKQELQAHESLLKKEIEKLKEQYQQILEDYRREISGINADMDSFSFLFNSYITQEG